MYPSLIPLPYGRGTGFRTMLENGKKPSRGGTLPHWNGFDTAA